MSNYSNRLYDTDLTQAEKRHIDEAVEYMEKTKYTTKKTLLVVVFSILLAIFLFFIASITNRYYNVWAMEMSGKAKLAEATQSRQIQVEQAKAEKEASTHTAEAIAIVGEATKAYPEYRQQLYIQAFAEALTEGTIDQIMYIPTEAGIPILEAGRLK